ncbi:MAG: type II toxin-antitoxin system PemK/MazF family toxin [Leptothrix sp. (in: b-proteobacteria)]
MVTSTSRYMPQRGHIVRLDFDPSAGHEQQGTRPALILSPDGFNRFGMALACPITRGGNFARGQAWTVPLSGLGLQTDGVVLCNQVRTLDWQSRRAALIETAPAELVGEVLARVATLIE